MTDDESSGDRVEDHMGGDELPVSLRVLLSDSSLWSDPSPELEAAVAMLVADAAVAASNPPPLAELVALRSERPTRRRATPLAAAASVVFLAGAVVVGANLSDTGGDPELAAPTFHAELSGSGSKEPSLAGRAGFIRTSSGWRVELDIAQLIRRADGEFYEAWLKDVDGDLVSLGTFNEGTDVVLWAGVSPEHFGTMSITRERADGDPTSSGDVAVVGPVIAP